MVGRVRCSASGTRATSDTSAIVEPWNDAPWCAMRAKLCAIGRRSEEHTSELQSRFDLVCRLLLEKKNKNSNKPRPTETGVSSERDARHVGPAFRTPPCTA